MTQPPAILGVYRRLRRAYGPAGWWPARSALEVCVGAILTQNTAWSNVEKAIRELRRRGLLSFLALNRLSAPAIAPLIRSAGTYRVKARRLRAFLDFLGREFGGQPRRMSREAPDRLRARLLAVHGIGEETADAIALYAAGHPVFVVDGYTRRILARLGHLEGGESYGEVQRLIVRALPRSAPLFNDCHAQLVRLAKEACRPRPRCELCPLDEVCPKRLL